MQLGGTKDLLKEKLETMAKSVAEREGCLLYDIEILGSGAGRVLRIYIDKDAEGGVSIEDCANVSKGMNLLLDVEDLFAQSYHLEVSSPGLERPLRQVWHFGRVLGSQVWVKTDQSMEALGVGLARIKSAKQLTAPLKAVRDDKFLVFELDEQEVVIPVEAVERAKVIYVFENENKLKPGRKPEDVKKPKKLGPSASGASKKKKKKKK